ncbi:MAG: hypothetical protein ABI240_04405 [Sphingomonas sp.]
MIIWLFMAPLLMEASPVQHLARNPDDALVNRFVRAIYARSESEISRVTEGRLFRVRAENDSVRVTSAEFLSTMDGCVHDEVTQSPATREIVIKWNCDGQVNVRRNQRQRPTVTYATGIRFASGVPSYFYREIPPPQRTTEQQACDMLRQSREQVYTLSDDIEAALKVACAG